MSTWRSSALLSTRNLDLSIELASNTEMSSGFRSTVNRVFAPKSGLRRSLMIEASSVAEDFRASITLGRRSSDLRRISAKLRRRRRHSAKRGCRSSPVGRFRCPVHVDTQATPTSTGEVPSTSPQLVENELSTTAAGCDLITVPGGVQRSAVCGDVQFATVGFIMRIPRNTTEIRGLFRRLRRLASRLFR